MATILAPNDVYVNLATITLQIYSTNTCICNKTCRRAPTSLKCTNAVGTASTKDEVAGGSFAFNLTNGYFAKTHELLKSLQITEVLLGKHLLKI